MSAEKLIAACALLIAAPTAARADAGAGAEQGAPDGDPRHRPYLWLSYGLANGAVEWTDVPDDHEEDSDISERFEAGGAYPLLPYLAIGGLAQHLRWRSVLDGATGRDGSVAHALSLVAELRGAPPNRAAVFFARAAAGAVLDDLSTSGGTGFEERSSLALGLHLGVRGGLQLVLAEHFGLAVELAFDRYFFSHTTEIDPGGGAASVSTQEIGYDLDTTTAILALIVPL